MKSDVTYKRQSNEYYKTNWMLYSFLGSYPPLHAPLYLPCICWSICRASDKPSDGCAWYTVVRPSCFSLACACPSSYLYYLLKRVSPRRP
ncbi:hypothetical protein EV702DRAFT_1122695 [Suillus placidus]|uniref:Uncharacterized protein n=1 Tax=Suillus placidus TaxID=48579 RepID=A0A9P7D0M4_9AGAM|nr:hypothetical protein EV702DRAFT_1122695 [Suillus placidus]